MPHTRERDRDADSASSSGQSKRPPLNHQESDSHSDTSGMQHQQPHHRQHHRHQRHHPVGRLHTARAPATKTVPKQPKLNRRHTSPPDSEAQQQRTTPSTAGASASSHRRANSDLKLSSRESSSTNLVKSPSHTKLKRNRSHVEVAKRSKSSDKLKRAASTTIVYQARAANKNQVHFDLGTDGQDDEWVDASGSNSPYMSRKGSIISSAHSSLPQGASAAGSRPVTPSERATSNLHDELDDQPDADEDEPNKLQQPEMNSPERQRAHHKEYLTSRLLQRTPSQGAPPQMTADLAQVAPRQFAPASVDDRDSTTLLGSTQDELTSRFVEVAGSGLTSEGSFYRPPRGDFSRYDSSLRKPQSVKSVTSLAAGRDGLEAALTSDEGDDSALAPKTSRRTAAPPAQTSRTQQKLDLQRASSVIEPGQAVSGVGGVVGANSGMGVGRPGYDGGSSRDPRVSKLLERTGLEYLVVRKYQNSVSRSLDRLSQLPGMEKSQRIPRTNTTATNGKRSGDLTMRHTRNVSMPDARRPITPRRANSTRTNGLASSFDGEDEARLNERLSGSSLVGGSEEDGTAAVLRNLWDKSMELSASH
ncbi:hypothetical protein B0J13DRAFT_175791 [Dactylonectria estremocensis]|uniref:Uncharacterized protein n=1 Tax=Dactylonectria estremocensis TaxID=1079267 RepID=A0A9P9JEW9_9HYPO|nr:hypothetical protein B0J13DRAFT_175791 [Dactylonectria estremocensis]